MFNIIFFYICFRYFGEIVIYHTVVVMLANIPPVMHPGDPGIDIALNYMYIYIYINLFSCYCLCFTI